MKTNKKYRITRATLLYKDGKKDIVQSSIYTDNIEEERKRLKTEFHCSKVNFRIIDYSSRFNYPEISKND